jgi:hypothetical protein
MSNKCEICGIKKSGHTSYCRTHKFAIRRAWVRVKAEGLLIDKAGGAWWVWDKKGEVLVIGEDSREHALSALALGQE